MIWVVLCTVGLVILIVGSVIGGLVRLVFARHREALSQNQVIVLVVLGIIAFAAMLSVATVVRGGWFVAPIVSWVVALAIIRNSAPLRETTQQRIAREASEKKRAAARKAVAERKRVDSFGKDGLGLMERAKLAVDTVMATEAVRDGWLGEPGDLDFSVDLTLIAESLRQARRIEKVVAESKAIPEPTVDDTKLRREAERTVKQLRSDVTRRVHMLNDCARQARQVDQTLAAERKQVRQAASRDDVNRRLSAELYGVEATPSAATSDAADAVTAHVAAFRELKNVIDEQRRLEITAAAEFRDGDPPAADDNVLAWVWRQLSFRTRALERPTDSEVGGGLGSRG